MIFREYKVNEVFNGHIRSVSIKVIVEEDDTPIEGDFDFGDPEGNAAYLARFKRGDLFMGYIHVTATIDGTEIRGTDSIGSCHLVSNNMFNPEPFEDSVRSILNDHAMVKNAICALRDNLKLTVEHREELAKLVGAS